MVLAGRREPQCGYPARCEANVWIIHSTSSHDHRHRTRGTQEGRAIERHSHQMPPQDHRVDSTPKRSTCKSGLPKEVLCRIWHMKHLTYVLILCGLAVMTGCDKPASESPAAAAPAPAPTPAPAAKPNPGPAPTAPAAEVSTSDKAKEVAAKAGATIKEVGSKTGQTLKEVGVKTGEKATEAWNAAKDSQAAEKVAKAADKAWDATKDTAGTVKDKAQVLGKNAKDIAVETGGKVREGTEKVLDKAGKQTEKAVDKVKDVSKEAAAKSAEAARTVADEAKKLFPGKN